MNNHASNGALTPPSADEQTPVAVAAPAKRKRSEDDAPVQVNGTTSDHDADDTRPFKKSRQTSDSVQAIYSILKSHDTTPSLLELPLDSASSPSPSNPDDLGNKQRHSKAILSTSIKSKAQSGEYSSVESLVRDVEDATSKIIGPLLAKEAMMQPGNYAKLDPLSFQETRLMTGALALQKMVKNMAASEQLLKKHVDSPPAKQAAVKDEQPKTNGTIEIKIERTDDESLDDRRSILTLYGHAQGPKQLFSSLQKPSKAGSILGKRSSELDTSVDVNVPIRDELLPNMISTTKIFPADTSIEPAKKRVRTMGDVFTPPASLRTLTPPKPAKATTLKSTSLTWEFPDSRSKPRKGSYNYTRESLTVGQWLGYRGVDQPQEPISPEAKRRQRDRALSTGEAQPKLSEEARYEVEQAKEDALFRSVYSSFAPSRDDSAAVVSAQTRDMVWWNKIGEKKFQQTFVVDPQLIDPALIEVDDDLRPEKNKDEDAAFQEAVDSFEPEGSYEEASGEAKDKQNDMDDLLKDISELLETLNSYQRIRNASLASHSHNRTPSVSSQQATVTSMSGSPTTPTSAEIDVYNMLKSQLTIMIKQLPPYAVAKLNGEQLADLTISKDILIETKDYRGVMEEDQISRLSKAAAINATASAPGVARMNSGSNQYSSSTPQYNRPLSGSQLGAGRPQTNYYPQQQPPTRTPSMPIQRTPTGQFASANSFSNSGVSRPGYGTQSFGQSVPRPGPGASYGSNSSAGNQVFRSQQFRPNQYYPNTPQAASQPRSYAQQTPSSNYQTRPLGPAQQSPMYGFNTANASSGHSSSQSPHARTASPLKAPLAPSQPPRSPFQHQPGTPTYGAPNGAPPIPLSVNSNNRSTYAQNNSGSATAPGTGPSGFYTSMSSAEQLSMMERQRAQLAAQQQQKATADQTIGSASPAGQQTRPSGAAIGA